MPYEAYISRSSSGCYLLLVDQSSIEDLCGSEVNKEKENSLADAVNRFLAEMIIKCARGGNVRDYFEIGVIGYGTNVGSMFSGTLAGKNLVNVSELCDHPVRVEESKCKMSDGAGGIIEETKVFLVWVDPVSEKGRHMRQAFEHAYQILRDWVGNHEQSFPPVIINICYGEGDDGNPNEAAERIKTLRTKDGPVLLFNIQMSSVTYLDVVFQDSATKLSPQASRSLFQISSILPDNMKQTVKRQGFVVGDQSRCFAFHSTPIDIPINLSNIPEYPE